MQNIVENFKLIEIETNKKQNTYRQSILIRTIKFDLVVVSLILGVMFISNAVIGIFIFILIIWSTLSFIDIKKIFELKKENKQMDNDYMFYLKIVDHKKYLKISRLKKLKKIKRW